MKTQGEKRENKRIEYFKEQVKKTNHDATLYTESGGWDVDQMQRLVDEFKSPRRSSNIDITEENLVEILSYMKDTFDLHTFLYAAWLRDKMSQSSAEAALGKECKREGGRLRRVSKGVYQKV